MNILISGSKILGENSYEMDVLLDEDFNFLQNENIEELGSNGETLEGLSFLWEENYETKREDFDRYFVVNEEYTVSFGRNDEFFRHVNLANAKYGARISMSVDNSLEEKDQTVKDIVKSVKEDDLEQEKYYEVDFEVLDVGKISEPKELSDYVELAEIYVKKDNEGKQEILSYLDKGKEDVYYKGLIDEYSKLEINELAVRLQTLNEICNTSDYMKVLTYIEELPNIEKMTILNELLMIHIESSLWKINHKED